jgi:hypothetical protein
VKKIIEFADTFPTGELTLQLVLPLRGGRFDVGRVTKHASDALDYIKNVSPEPGKTHLLLLAMGAEETYGPNRNGDGFSEYPVPARGKEATARGERWWVAPGQELTQTYRTFETNPAHTFKHHQNKDPAKASGYVKRAFWNPRMHRVELLTVIDNEKDAEWVDRVEQGEFPAVSMGCFLAGARVTLADGTQKAIEEIIEGDEVITHRGRARRVSSTHKRPYRGNIHAIRGEAHATIYATDEHPFWTTAWGSVKEKERAKGNVRWRPDARVEGEWTHASCLESQLLLAPIDRTEATTPELSRTFARLLGYYVAEGHIIWREGSPYGIELTTNQSDAIHTEICQLCAEFGTRNAPWTYVRANCESARGIMICDDKLAALCLTHGGVSARQKKLSKAVMHWPPEMQRELFGAYANGDGCGRDGWLKVSTASSDLASQWRHMLLRLGILASCNQLTHKAGSGFSTEDTFEWVIHIGVQWAYKLKTTCAKVEAREVLARKESRKIVGDYVCVPIREIETQYAETQVFNLEVEEDESYLIEGLAVHNCKIKYDVCSRCGNKAPSRAEYCKHALAMNQVNPDGTKNFVYNPDSDFFDISRVFRPADRIGYTLKKVADAGGRLAADLGVEADAAARKTAAARKLSEMSKVIRGEPIAISTVSRGERDLAVRFRDYAGDRLSGSPGLPSRVVQAAALSPGVGLRGVVTTADRAGVVLKDAEFAEAAISQLTGRPTRVAHDVLVRLAAAADAALELFSESPSLLDHVLDECKLGEASNVDAALASALARIREKRAYAGDMLYRRLVPEGAGLRPDAAPTTDLLHAGNEVTTRGAALEAQDAVTRAHMRKVLGGTALMLGSYKMLTAYPWLRKARAPLAVGIGALGQAALSPRPGSTRGTAEGVDVPDVTETAPKMAALISMVECRSPSSGALDISRAKIGSVVDPIVGLVLDVEHVVDFLGSVVIG